ncbi:hypothetical protein FEDK69T_03730 [Flavobacterium enshiense DK69]|uniref:Secretion system C-terminal sorting domain-containing protein n=1 Tax=Flavobacterium enshiense DK69 TaxID=1107311 RepID=V6SKA0_9FLAO|nr:T9SS type A sorting domain-containing protein [Flavobacterium enshiense]ESU24820.1 hypothetical protein FEDK69T_03730 [Flavobacterium enshiense DK69]KGO96726.1 hypothetical protein Q767_03185 [Flavobacterium enshiense DK69]
MKRKLLLFSVLFGLYASAEAQVLQSDNFNSLTVGNIGTDLTGATAGQGNWFTNNTPGGTNGGNSNYQIVANDATHLNVAQITGSNAATGEKALWKGGLATAWSTRTSTNNIIEVEFSVNIGAATTSLNDLEVLLFNAEETKVLAGLVIFMDTRQVIGAAYVNNNGTLGNYGIPLGGTNPVLQNNTWYRMGFSFNKTTGQIKFKGPGFNGQLTGAAIGVDPNEVDFIMNTTAGNTVAGVCLLDNYSVKATNTDTLLGTEAFTSVESSKLSVYPNPVNDIVTISNAENLQINKVAVTDVNGRTVKTLEFGGVTETQINVSDLNSGIYFMSIDTNEGTATKKIIKN